MRGWLDRSPMGREYQRKKAKEYHAAHPGHSKNTNLRLRYGITIDEYKKILASQNGVCAICKLPETTVHKRSGKIRDLAVDHCHDTGKIRGLLCGDCNRSLGMMKEDTWRLFSMVSYLSKHKTDEKLAA